MNQDDTQRFRIDFVVESGALKSVRAIGICIENKHYFWGTTRGDEALRAAKEYPGRAHQDT